MINSKNKVKINLSKMRKISDNNKLKLMSGKKQKILRTLYQDMPPHEVYLNKRHSENENLQNYCTNSNEEIFEKPIIKSTVLSPAFGTLALLCQILFIFLVFGSLPGKFSFFINYFLIISLKTKNLALILSK